MIIHTTKDALNRALRSHGEEDAAARALVLNDEQMNVIGDRAGWYVMNRASGRRDGRSIFIDTALALAAIEFFEGAPRELRWKRRRLKGIY